MHKETKFTQQNKKQQEHFLVQSFCYFMQELLGEDNVQVRTIKMFSMWTHASTTESLLQIRAFQKVQLD
jgi:hypothetical protein